jgi:hypothetical protein
MWLNVHASSNRETLSRGGSISFVHEVGVVREVVLAVLGRIERVRVVGHDAQLAAQIEGAAVDVHRAHQRLSVVDDDQLRVHPQILLLVHLHTEPLQRPQRCEGIENVPFADAVPATEENVHLDTAIRRRREALENDRINVFGVLYVPAFGSRVDELRYVVARIRIAPQ